MKVLLKYISVITLLLLWTTSKGAYLTNVPVTVTQPSGEVLHIYASGDEFYNWLHDADGYTIIQDPETGYYCYADLNESKEIYATNNIVGVSKPKELKLSPNIKLPSSIISSIRDKESRFHTSRKESVERLLQSRGTHMYNLVIYIRFEDEQEFPERQSDYELMFNGKNTGNISMYNYFKEVSYSNLYIESYFPQCNGNKIVSYQDDKPRGYYQVKTNSNTIGYDSKDDYARCEREYELLSKAIKHVEKIMPQNINLDGEGSGWVDNVCFIIRGDVNAWNDLLWPHRAWLPNFKKKEDELLKLNGYYVGNYNLHLENRLNAYSEDNRDVGVLCHEMFHTLGAPDLYQYKKNDDINYGIPVGSWDLMEKTQRIPQHMSAYMKFEYGGWIKEIPEITESGTYTLNPIWRNTNNCYKLATNNPNEYFVLEYRKKRESGRFESTIPASGLVIYRIHVMYDSNGFKIDGNSKGYGYGGQHDEVYVFRPYGSPTNDGDYRGANLPGANNKQSFNGMDNDFYCFLSDGTRYNISINNISESRETISFSIKFCDVENKTITSSEQLPQNVNAVTITTNGSVVVKSTENVIFDANKVALKPGFKAQKGSRFKISNEGCCVKRD